MAELKSTKSSTALTKYRYRADRKNGDEDIAKANWYMDKLMELGNSSDNEIDFTTTSTYFK